MSPRRPPALLARPAALVLCAALGLWLTAAGAAEPLSLADYKYFRALSIDLQGRMPTGDEITAFEGPGFDLDKWLDAHLQGPEYAARLTRVYADLMRPQINGLRYPSQRSALVWITFLGPDGKLTRLYWRPGQLRRRTAALRQRLNADPGYKQCAAIKDPIHDDRYQSLGCARFERYDNLLRTGMCMQADELGVRHATANFPATPFPAQPGDKPGDPPRVGPAQEVLDQYTVAVRPWWLYADFRAEDPRDRYDAQAWAARFPGYVLQPGLLKEPDGKTDTLQIRVCREEASLQLMAQADNPNLKEAVSCQSGFGAAQSSQCGCGPGLEWCLPALSGNPGQPQPGFLSSRSVLLGVDDPTDQQGLSLFEWQSLWLTQEPLQVLNHIFAEDRDFREVVTGRYTYVNGPLAQFYRFSARSFFADADPGQTPLPLPEALPQELSPMDAMHWQLVADRGPSAAGILTEPWFNMKNATRRARAHVVYNLFLCRDFVAPQGLRLPPSTEPDLVKRTGCAACHQTLEPLAAYFARVVENDWSWLDPKVYPAQSDKCRRQQPRDRAGPAAIPAGCSGRYDNAFSTASFGMLRGAYAAPEHADKGPAGLARELVQRPEFAACVVQNVATSFLGRDLRTEDGDLKKEMAEALTSGGYRVRPMLKVLLNSNAYRSANNLSSTAWRGGGRP